MLARLCTLAVLLALCLCASARYNHYRRTSALERYVDSYDPAYNFELAAIYPGDGYSLHVLNLTSQSYLGEGDTDNYLWVHWLLVCIPDQINYDTGYVWIASGSASTPMPADATDFRDLAAPTYCSDLGIITAEIQQIPNQPITFTDDVYGTARIEDAFIAYTWSAFLNDTSIDPEILARFPMTKAVVRAMDAIQEYTRDDVNVDIDVEKFIVGGASKRGWTSWTTGAVDDRVVAITPVVIPILDVDEVASALYRDLGEWTFAFSDYLEQGTDTLKFLFEPEWRELAEEIDPISFVRDLEMPKYIVAATGDQFFAPDSPNFFFNRLRGEKHLYLMHNADHSFSLPPGGDAEYRSLKAIETFVAMILEDIPRPEISWRLKESNNGPAEITLRTDRCSVQPTEVKAWSADTIASTGRRDWRLTICSDLTNPVCLSQLGIAWTSETITPSGNSGRKYKIEKSAPAAGGWTGFFLEASFEYGPETDGLNTFVSTTFANIVPKYRPFDDCPEPLC